MAKNKRQPTEDRLSAGAQDDDRDSRSTLDQREEGREDRGEAWLDELTQETILPTLPDIPGYKVAWLSPTHPSDTIARRLRIGYTPITLEDIREFAEVWKSKLVTDGAYSGLIGCNEMLAFKISEDRWNRIMQKVHHDMPNAEEGKIRANVEGLSDKLRASGSKLMVGDGTKSLGRGPTKGIFD